MDMAGSFQQTVLEFRIHTSKDETGVFPKTIPRNHFQATTKDPATDGKSLDVTVSSQATRQESRWLPDKRRRTHLTLKWSTLVQIPQKAKRSSEGLFATHLTYRELISKVGNYTNQKEK